MRARRARGQGGWRLARRGIGEGPAGAGAAPLLAARDLTVRFGRVTALDRLTVTAPAGQVLAVLGPNGAGKTTFIRAIATLIRPDGGELRVLGHDVVTGAASVRREIGLAGQYAAVEPARTGRENLELTARLFGHGRRAARRAASAVIDQLSLGAVADRRCGTYSGGQRRRLDLGASLVGAPSLLLLDEPTTGLDPVSRREVWDAVRGLAASGTGILLTTHYLAEADELADQVVVIDHGRTIAAGSLTELKAQHRARRDRGGSAGWLSAGPGSRGPAPGYRRAAAARPARPAGERAVRGRSGRASRGHRPARRRGPAG